MIKSFQLSLNLNISTKCIVLLVSLISLQTQAADSWKASVDENNGLLTISTGGSNLLTSSFVFFGQKWAWAGQETNFKIIAPGQYNQKGSNKLLGFNLNADISTPSGNKISWVFELDSPRKQQDVIGGGISFKFDLNSFAQSIGEPDILPDKTGWSWGKGSNRIEMRFEPKLPEIFFERGNKKELRAYFYSGSIPEGKQKFTATLTGNIAVTPTTTELYGVQDTSRWPKNLLDWKSSPVDLSFLNSSEIPAGKRGFIKAKGEKLVFEDGTQGRFWGANISAYTLFGTPKDIVKVQAKRLSALGFNLVRIHHFDSPWVNPNIFGDKKNSNTQQLDATSMEKLDWWISCLKEEGIYIWLDLHVQRAFKEEDNIYGFDEIRKGKPDADLKGYNYVNLTILNAMKRFNADYLNHVNTYTHLAYKNEPAIIALLITNENDITHHFGNALLPDKNVPQHSKLYMSEANGFSRVQNLPKDKVWRSWEPGPSKLFLNDLEYRFNMEMISYLRELGAKVPIATTSTWGNNPLSSLPALTAGDMIDVHAYQGEGALCKNPLITPNLTHWIAAAQVVGKPLSVTEWNAEPFPTPDRHTLPLYVASQASFQGWDAIMQYAYAQISLRDAGRPSNWDTFNDPSQMATMPAAALMYRQAHVHEANITYVFDFGKDALFNQPISPANSAAIRTAAELGKVQIAMPSVKELPWLKKSALPSDAKVIKNYQIPLLKENATEATIDTGEIRRNWDRGYLTINTAKSQVASGWIGGEKIVLNDTEISATTRNATVAVQSLDGSVINKSRHLLVSLGARSVPSTGNKLPFYSEPVEGTLFIKAPRGLKATKQTVLQKKESVPFKYINGRYKFKLDSTIRTYWIEMAE